MVATIIASMKLLLEEITVSGLRAGGILYYTIFGADCNIGCINDKKNFSAKPFVTHQKSRIISLRRGNLM